MSRAFETVSDDEQAAAFMAWKRGETIEFWNTVDGKWWPIFHSTQSLHKDHVYRRKPQPKLRPWKPEEIPVGAVVRETVGIQPHARWLITSVDYQGVAYTAYGQNKVTTLALEGREYSIDGGKTWAPCGVVE